MLEHQVSRIFDAATKIVDALPVTELDGTFYSKPLISGTEQKRAWVEASKKLPEVAQGHRPILIWASDAAAGAGELDLALSIFPALPPLARRSVQASSIMSLKQVLQLPLAGSDVLALFGPQLTKFGRENIEHIKEYLTIRLDALQREEGRDLISEWADDAHEMTSGYSLFNGHASYLCTKPPRGLSFQLSRTAKLLSTSLIREAENVWREDNGIPRVGEGWVSETVLYYSVKDAFPSTEVLQHAGPSWLGRQHLDVFLPELRVALEYQGVQHDRPVEFFGGEEAYARTIQRDKRKLNLCRRHGVKIIYVREGYDFDAIVQQIKDLA